MKRLEELAREVENALNPKKEVLSVEISGVLDGLCRALRSGLASPGPADREALRRGFETASRIAVALRSGKPLPPANGKWHASLAGIPENGSGALILEDTGGRQEIRFHLDAKGSCFLGTWQSLADGTCLCFGLKSQGGGDLLLCFNEKEQREVPLGTKVSGFSWTKEPAFSFKSKEALPGFMAGILDEIRGLIPGDGAREEKKPAPQAAASRSCSSCRSPLSPNAPFCGSCGAEAVPEKAPSCPGCGKPVRKGAKFCGICGAKLR